MIEDRLDFGEPVTPRPLPVPVPRPVAPPSAWTTREKVLAWTTLASVLVMLAVAWWKQYHETTPAPSSIVALGNAFIPKLAGSLADGFDAAGDAIRDGKTMGQADQALKDRFATARAVALANHAEPAFSAIVPPGTEPTDRVAAETMYRDFARGLRGASK